jgi:hypothetical protein
MPACAEQSWRRGLAAACAMHAALGLASMVRYDVSTLYFEPDTRGWFARARVLQGMPAKAADHDRVAHRRDGVPVDFRMSKHDLHARPIYHGEHDSIEANLSIGFAALAVNRLTEDRTGWSINKFVRTAQRYRTVEIRAGQQILTAEDPSHPTPYGRTRTHQLIEHCTLN